MSRAVERNGHVEVVSRNAGRRIFDRLARKRLGISGKEFLRRWDAGDWKDPDSDPNVMDVWALLPLAR